MKRKLLRLLALLAVLLGAVAGGALASWLSGMPVIGLLCGAALAIGAMLADESLAGARLHAWLRADTRDAADVPGATNPPPRQAGVWGELGYRMHKALRRREQLAARERQRLTQFLAAVQATPIGVLLVDAQQRISWCSRTAAEHLGLDAQRDLGQTVTNLVRTPAFVEHLLGGGDQPVALVGAGGSRISALVQPYGEGLKLVLTQDITERERAEAMRRNFVANVSHEIRTPLTALSGFVETMIQLPLSEPERQRVLALMAGQARRMQALVADLLTLAQLEGSPRPPADQWLRVSELIDRARADAVALSEGRHELHFGGGEETDAQIAGDASELHSALGNLVVNAVRYTAAGGRIDVQWTVDGAGAGALRVADTGVGIPREHLPRLTERFYRVDGSRSRDTGGTGLGLSIVKHVMQRHGGQVEIHSEPGRGSSFTLLLPPSRVRRGLAAPQPVVETVARTVG